MANRHLVAGLLLTVLLCAPAGAQERPKKVYVPNPTGDVSDKVGAVMASEVSAALMKRGIQAFTYANLKEQLKQEEYKEILQCEKDSRCVDELVAGFGVATRIFTQMTKLGRKSYHLELSLETKGRFKNKVTRKAKNDEDGLGDVAANMALELLGLEEASGGTGSNGSTYDELMRKAKELEADKTHVDEKQAEIEREWKKVLDVAALDSLPKEDRLEFIRAFLNRHSGGNPFASKAQHLLEIVAERSASASASTPRGDMVLISAGSFMMGCNGLVDGQCEDDELPYHEVYLGTYHIDRHEVTVAEFRLCVDAGGCAPGNHRTNSVSQYCNSGHPERDDHPMNCVEWLGAADYCKWAGKRLPTEAEWEKAARGTDGRQYPWGDEEPSCDRAVMSDGGFGCGEGRTWPVCSKESGNSPYGLCDVAGNVWEWVADLYGPDYYELSVSENPMGPSSGTSRLTRGGSWNFLPKNLRTSFRGSAAPVFKHAGLGFRCAAPAD